MLQTVCRASFCAYWSQTSPSKRERQVTQKHQELEHSKCDENKRVVLRQIVDQACIIKEMWKTKVNPNIIPKSTL